jgi:PAS domain S-box-containing protein
MIYNNTCLFFLLFVFIQLAFFLLILWRIQRKRRDYYDKESYERLKLALSGANDGVWDWDLTNNRVHYDDIYYTMAGYKPGDFPEHLSEWENRVAKEDREKLEEAILNILDRGNRDFEAEYRFRRKDGSYMWIRGKGQVVAFNDDAVPLRLVGTHSDVTPLKAAEQALKESLETRQRILRNLPIIIWSADLNGLITSMEGSALEKLNFTNEDFLGKSIFTLYRANPQALDDIERGYRGEYLWSERIYGADVFQVFTAPQHNKEGLITGIYGLGMNITERKKMEREVDRLKNNLSLIINSMPSLIAAVDREGNITQWNDTAIKETGISAEEAKGKNIALLLPRLHLEMSEIEAAMAKRQTWQNRVRLKENEAGDIYKDIFAYSLKGEHQDGAVLRIDDVTEKVRFEELIVQNEKMLSVGGLAAGMAHEINNPLTGIINSIDVIKRRMTDPSMVANQSAAEKVGISLEASMAYMEDRGVLQMLEIMTESGSRIAEIVRNMLSFARKEEGANSSYKPAQLVDSILELASSDYDLKKKYDFKSIKIIKEYEENLPEMVCEGGKIQQVLLNLFQNGAYAMLQKSNVPGYIPQFIIRLKKEENPLMIRLEVEDNGPGMSMEIQKRIFEPFFTTKPVGIATGLGLSVSYFIIVENHGGTLDVRSAPEEGAVFIIKLPLHS